MYALLILLCTVSNVLKYRIEKNTILIRKQHVLCSFKKIPMNLFTWLRNEILPPPVFLIVQKIYFFFFFLQREDVIFITHCRSLASPACTSDFNRTLCYYRMVRTLYYLFPTQPCIESQKVTRFHVAQLCRRSFPQKLGVESFKSTKYISHILRLIYIPFNAILRDVWCVLENEETIDRICICVREDYILRSSGTLHWLFAHGISFKGERFVEMSSP